MQKLMHMVLIVLLCGGVAGALVGGAEAFLGVDGPLLLSIFFAAGILIPLGMMAFGMLAVFTWLLPPALRPWALKERLSTANPHLFARVISYGLAFVILLSFVYRVALFFMTKFHHMGLAAFALMLTLMGMITATAVISARISILVEAALKYWRISEYRWVKPLFGLVGVVCILTLLLIHGYAFGKDGSGAPMGFMSLLKLDGLGAAPLVSLMAILGISCVLAYFSVRAEWRLWVLAGSVLLLIVVAPITAYRVSAFDTSCADRVNAVGGLAQIGGKVIRHFGDRDGDGHARWFGGRDCDDLNSHIYPGATEIPDNHIDEDCTGEDLNLESLKQRVQVDAPRNVELKKPDIPEDVSVLLITVDALRTDAVGFMGQERPLTPNLDALFASGVIYDNAYSVSSYTSQSIPAMMTGKYPSELERTDHQKMRVSLRETFAAEKICREEVTCGGLMSHFLFKEFYGWSQGFQHWEYVNGVPKDAPSTAEVTTSPDVTRIALNWMSNPKNTGDRFFMWVHYMDPHGDYILHDGFKRFGETRRDGYDHEVLYTDYYIGILLKKFAELGLDKRTVVIVTADHGESFMEHGRWLHGYELYEELVRIPLAITGPGIPSKHITRPTSAIHIYSTLLDLFGLDVPEGGHSTSLLADWMPNQELVLPYVVCDLAANEKYEPRRAIIHNGWKLHVFEKSGTYKLFKLSEPGEKNSLETSHPEQFNRMKDLYDLFVATRLHPVPSVTYQEGALSKMPLPGK